MSERLKKIGLCVCTSVLLVFGASPGSAELFSIEASIEAPLSFVYGTLPFLHKGQKICRFTLIYVDNRPNEALVAELYSTDVVVAGTAFPERATIARIETTGAKDVLRKKSTIAIASPTIDTAQNFYSYAIFHIPNPEPTFDAYFMGHGIQLDVRASCP